MKILTKDELLTAVDKAIDKLEAGKGSIQRVLESTAMHMAEHGDWTIANTVIEKMNASERNMTHEAAGAVKWFVKYCGLKHDKEGFEGWSKAQFIKDNYQVGRQNPYWKSITVAKPFEFNLAVEVAKLISRSNSAMKKGKAAHEGDIEANVIVDQAMLDGLKALNAGEVASQGSMDEILGGLETLAA